MVLWALGHVGAAAVFTPQGARERVPVAYTQIRRGKGKGLAQMSTLREPTMSTLWPLWRRFHQLSS